MIENFIAVLRVFLSLTVVLVLAYWSIRYLLPRMQGNAKSNAGAMTVIGRLPLGIRSTLCLVQVGERCFLIGVTPGGMEFLAEVPADEIPALGPEMMPPPDFAEILAKSRASVNMFREKVEKKVGAAKAKKERGHEDEQQEKQHNDD
jgi:flagellar biosynthetic protein FliO